MTDDTSSGQRWTDEREIRISADPERVWEAWAEPEHVRRWFSDDAHGRLEPGGELVHEFDGHGAHRYTVVEVEAPRRLVLEGEMEGRAFRQEVEIRREGGTTVLKLVHSGFGPSDPDSEIVQGIDSGWTMALALLKHYVEHHFGRDKVMISAFRPARFEYDRLLRDWYRDGAGLKRWLTVDGGSLRRGEEVELRLRDRRPLSGSVLALTDHEISVSWEEVEGVLELKAFGSGPEARILGTRLVTWSDDPERVGELAAELEAAVDRLVAGVQGEGESASA